MIVTDRTVAFLATVTAVTEIGPHFEIHWDRPVRLPVPTADGRVMEPPGKRPPKGTPGYATWIEMGQERFLNEMVLFEEEMAWAEQTEDPRQPQ